MCQFILKIYIPYSVAAGETNPTRMSMQRLLNPDSKCTNKYILASLKESVMLILSRKTNLIAFIPGKELIINASKLCIPLKSLK